MAKVDDRRAGAPMVPVEKVPVPKDIAVRDFAPMGRAAIVRLVALDVPMVEGSPIVVSSAEESARKDKQPDQKVTPEDGPSSGPSQASKHRVAVQMATEDHRASRASPVGESRVEIDRRAVDALAGLQVVLMCSSAAKARHHRHRHPNRVAVRANRESAAVVVAADVVVGAEAKPRREAVPKAVHRSHPPSQLLLRRKPVPKTAVE